MSKTVFPTWLRDNPPKDRQFRALAYNADCRDSSGFVRVVAEWDGNADEWRPVEVSRRAPHRNQARDTGLDRTAALRTGASVYRVLSMGSA